MAELHSQQQVLQRVLKRCEQSRQAGRTPVVVFDLDHTLFDNGPRTIKILNDFAADRGASDLVKQLAGISPYGLPYLIEDILLQAGCEDAALRAEARQWWMQHFFIDEHIKHDVPNPGTQDYVREVFDRGSTVVYLTGRDAPNMFMGTVGSLHHFGFPVGLARTVTILKPAFEVADLEFKTEVSGFCGSLGELVASFDNEPANVNLFVERYPESEGVLVGDIAAPGAPPLHADAHRIADFRMG